MAIKQFIDFHNDNHEKNPFSKAQHLLGVAESGIPDLGQNHRKYLIEKIKSARK